MSFLWSPARLGDFPQEKMNIPFHPRPRPATWAILLAFSLVYVSWGTTYLAIQRGVRDENLPPALFGGTRVCLAGLILLTYLMLRRQPIGISARDWRGVFVSSLLLFVAGNGLVNLAERTVPSGVTAVLVATTPLWIGMLEMFWPAGDRLTAGGWLGLLVGLSGVLLLLAPHIHDPGDFWQDAGPLLVLGSAASWALGSLIVRHRRLTCSHLSAAAFQMIIGGGSLALVGLALGEWNHLPETVTPSAAGAFFYLLIVGSLVGFIAFNWLLGHVSAATVGTYAYVNPIVAVAIAWWTGEEISGWLLAGIGVILTGVALVRSGERSPTAKMNEVQRPTGMPRHHPDRPRLREKPAAASKS
jgi:drug/metabolite transporter (DMT)-like permease